MTIAQLKRVTHVQYIKRSPRSIEVSINININNESLSIHKKLTIAAITMDAKDQGSKTQSRPTAPTQQLKTSYLDSLIIIDLHSDEYRMLYNHRSTIIDILALGEVCRFGVPLLGRPKVTQTQCHELKRAFSLLQLDDINLETLDKWCETVGCVKLIYDDELMVLKDLATRIESNLKKWEPDHPAWESAKGLKWRNPDRKPVEGRPQLFENFRRGIQSAFDTAVGYLACEADAYYDEKSTALEVSREIVRDLDDGITRERGWLWSRTVKTKLRECIKPYLELHQRFGVLNSLQINERFERPSMEDTTELLQIWQGRALIDFMTMEVLLAKARHGKYVGENDIREMTKDLVVWGFDPGSFLQDVKICPQLGQEYFDKMVDTFSGKYVEKDCKNGLKDTLQKGREMMKEAGRDPVFDGK